eukprot:6081071-Ditylum_brightwellii.AAC.1
MMTTTTTKTPGIHPHDTALTILHLQKNTACLFLHLGCLPSAFVAFLRLEFLAIPVPLHDMTSFKEKEDERVPQ